MYAKLVPFLKEQSLLIDTLPLYIMLVHVLAIERHDRASCDLRPCMGMDLCEEPIFDTRRRPHYDLDELLTFSKRCVDMFRNLYIYIYIYIYTYKTNSKERMISISKIIQNTNW